MKAKITKLIDVKTIVTLAVVTVFCYGFIAGKINSESFNAMTVMIIGFYFGKKATETVE